MTTLKYVGRYTHRVAISRSVVPACVAAGAHKGELVWTPLSLGRACTAHYNPWYAGEYVFGRCRHHKRADGRFWY
jgi:hypothetical protein